MEAAAISYCFAIRQAALFAPYITIIISIIISIIIVITPKTLVIDTYRTFLLRD
jgi:hypothetical protein